MSLEPLSRLASLYLINLSLILLKSPSNSLGKLFIFFSTSILYTQLLLVSSPCNSLYTSSFSTFPPNTTNKCDFNVCFLWYSKNCNKRVSLYLKNSSLRLPCSPMDSETELLIISVCLPISSSGFTSHLSLPWSSTHRSLKFANSLCCFVSFSAIACECIRRFSFSIIVSSNMYFTFTTCSDDNILTGATLIILSGH